MAPILTTAVLARRTLIVDNADDLAAAWCSAGAEAYPPQDTEWGQHEGAVVDPYDMSFTVYVASTPGVPGGRL